MKFQLKGFSEFEQTLKEMGQMYRADLVAKNTIVKAAKTAMEVALPDAISNAPFDEKHTDTTEKPHLRDTIKVSARIPSDSDKKSDYVRDTDAAIAVLSAKASAVSMSQEFGNARTPAHPFLRISVERNIPNILDTLHAQLEIEIPKMAEKIARKNMKGKL
jgi:HK97 gp10 family phage protein